MGKIRVLEQTEVQVPSEKGELRTLTHITYRTEEGQIGFVTIPKAKPSDSDIAEAVKKQLKEAAERKPREITY